MSTNQPKNTNNQVFLVVVLGENDGVENYITSDTSNRTAYGLDFKGQLVTTTQLKKVEKELTFEISAEKQTQLCVPWQRIIKVRNISFEKKQKEL
jgi:hypothetical protein